MADNQTREERIHPDSRMPTELGRQQLSRMLLQALVEIRLVGGNGKATQASDLADAFHNLPVYLWSDKFSVSFFRIFLEEYQEKYQEESSFNYLKMLDEIYSKETEP